MDDTQALDCTQALPDECEENTTGTEPTIVAWLEVSGTRHDVFMGETKIGRDPATCKIVLNSKALSRQHAVIEADWDVHTLADMDTMNKTRIGRMILKPEVRYALHGGESVRFGDVQALYIRKPVSQDVDSGSETESESMLHLETSEDRTASPILTHHLPGLDTPVIRETRSESDISDIIPATPLPMRPLPQTGMNTIILESPTLSQSTPLPKKSVPKADQTSSPNVSLIQKLDESNEDSFNFDPSQPSKKAVTKMDEGNKPSDLDGYNSDSSTDIEGDEDIPTQVFSCDTKPSKTEEEGQGDAKLEEERRMSDDEDEKGWSSDASTDIEDVFNQPTQPFSSANKTPGQNRDNVRDGNVSPADQSYEDCTQDIMAAFGLKAKKDTEEKKKLDTSDLASDMMAPTQLFSDNGGKVNGKQEEADPEAATQVFSGGEQESAVFRKPLATAPKPRRKSKGLLNNSLDADFLNAPTQACTSGMDTVDVFNAPTQPFAKEVPNDDFLDESNNDIFNAPTQPFDKELPKDNFLDQPTQPFCNDNANEDTSCAPTQPFTKELPDDVFDQPTQPFDNDNANEDTSCAPTQPFTKELPDDIFDQPTQPFNNDAAKNGISSGTTNLDMLDAPTQDVLPSPQKKGDKKRVSIAPLTSLPGKASTENYSDSDDDDDIFNQPTQPFQPNSTLVKGRNSISDRKLSTKDALSDNDDDIFNQPTQPFQPNSTLIKGRNSISDRKLSTKDVLSDNDDDDDIFNQPTQIFTEEKNTDVDLDAPTQVLDCAAAQPDDSLPPTQPFIQEPISKVSKASLSSEASYSSEITVLRNNSAISESDLDAPTQMFEEDLYDAPTQPFSEVSKKVPITPTPLGPTKSILQLWDGLDNAPTQELNMETPKDANSIKDKCEDQDDTASDASETLLSERQFDSEENTCIPKSNTNKKLSTDKSSAKNKSVDKESVEADTEQEDKCKDPDQDDSASDASETLLSERQLDDEYLDVLNKNEENACISNSTSKELPSDENNAEKKCVDKESVEDDYNSDVSTDIEDESPSPNNTNSSRERQTSESVPQSETSLQEHSIDSGIGGSKQSHQLTSHQENKDHESTSVTPYKNGKGKKNTVTPYKNDKGKKKMIFRRLSKLSPVATSSPACHLSVLSKSFQGSPALTDFSDSIFNFELSDSEDSEDMAKAKGTLRDRSHQLLSSDSESESHVYNESQKLFDLSPSSTKDFRFRGRYKGEDYIKNNDKSVNDTYLIRSTKNIPSVPESRRRIDYVMDSSTDQDLNFSGFSTSEKDVASSAESVSNDAKKDCVLQGTPKDETAKVNAGPDMEGLSNTEEKNKITTNTIEMHDQTSSSITPVVGDKHKSKLDEENKYRLADTSVNSDDLSVAVASSSSAQYGRRGRRKAYKKDSIEPKPSSSKTDGQKRSSGRYSQNNKSSDICDTANVMEPESSRKAIAGTSKSKIVDTGTKRGRKRSSPLPPDEENNTGDTANVMEPESSRKAVAGTSKSKNVDTGTKRGRKRSSPLPPDEENNTGDTANVMEPESSRKAVAGTSKSKNVDTGTKRGRKRSSPLPPDEENNTGDTANVMEPESSRKAVAGTSKSKNVDTGTKRGRKRSSPLPPDEENNTGDTANVMEPESSRKAIAGISKSKNVDIGTKRGRKRSSPLPPDEEIVTFIKTEDTADVLEPEPSRKASVGKYKRKPVDTGKKRDRKQSSPLPPDEEITTFIKTEIKTEDTDEEVDIEQQMLDPLLKVEVKFEEPSEHVEVQSRSRRKIKEPARFSPERETTTRKTRGRKSDTTQVKQGSLEITTGKRTRRSARAEPSTAATEMSSEESMMSAQYSESSTDADDLNIMKRRISVPTPENDPVTGVDRRRSRGRPRKTSSPTPHTSSEQSQPPQPQRSMASIATAQPTRRTTKTRASITTDQTDPLITKRTRLDTVPEIPKDKDSDASSTPENNPVTDVECRRSRGRPKNTPSLTPHTISRASIATAQPTQRTAKTSQKTRVSIATDQTDPFIIKRARLDTVLECPIDHDTDIKAGHTAQARNQRNKNSVQTEKAQEEKDTHKGEPSMPGPAVAQKRRNVSKRTSRKNSEESSEDQGQFTEEGLVLHRARKRNSSEDSTDQDSSRRRGRSRRGSPPLVHPLCSPSSRQQKANNKPRVLFTGYKDTRDEKIVTELGGWLVDSPQACSVLVTTRVCRTFKLLAVIGKGQPIVSPAWLAACKAANCFVDPWQYLVEDRSAEEEFGFSLEQSLQSASKVSLFEGLAIHATTSVKPAPIQMKEIIVCSGGRYLDQPPKKFAPQIMIVSCPEDRKQWSLFKKLGIPVLGTEFVLTGLLRHELLLEEFILG